MASSTVASAAASSHRLSLENVQPKAAKASLKKYEGRDFRAEIGKALLAARSIVGWTQEQLTQEIAEVLTRDKFDQAQVARWESGKERPQFDVLFAIEALRWPLITSLARLDEKNEIETTIRRTA